ncbi:MAG: helix-turn-helix domain-containing protein [Planctomycetota bacterium]
MIQSNSTTPAPAPASEKLGYSRVEAAALLSVSVRTIDNLIADQTSGFPIRRIGRKVVIPRRDLEIWLDRQTEAYHQRNLGSSSGGA